MKQYTSENVHTFIAILLGGRITNSSLVSIIIVNWNQKELLEGCLASIKDHTQYSNFNAIVVDNGSADGSIEMVRREFPWVELIENKMNMGYAKANNQGLKHALKEKADYMFLLNNDTRVIQNDWLMRMVEIAQADPDVGIVGCKLIYPDGRIQHAGGRIDFMGNFHYGEGKPDDGTFDETREVDYVTGAAFMIKRELLQKIGLLDEGFAMAYFEDADYCARAKLAGYKVIYNPKTTIVHYESATTKRIPKQEINFIVHKNRLRFILLNFPLKWIVRRAKYELIIIIDSVAEKKDEERKLSPLNARIRKEWHRNLATLLKAYLEDFQLLGQILQKRRCRTSRVWD